MDAIALKSLEPPARSGAMALDSTCTTQSNSFFQLWLHVRRAQAINSNLCTHWVVGKHGANLSLNLAGNLGDAPWVCLQREIRTQF